MDRWIHAACMHMLWGNPHKHWQGCGLHTNHEIIWYKWNKGEVQNYDKKGFGIYIHELVKYKTDLNAK